MKLSLDDIPPGKNQANGLHKTPLLILIIFTLIILLVIPLYSPLVNYSLFLSHSLSKPPSSYIYDEQASPEIPPLSSHACDIFTGEWIRNLEAPYYTNRTCWAIHEHQNCMKYGRPDLDFMKWRWKPDGCDLPIFNPAQFLELVRDKSMAFVGDSVSRNQLQSLICLLSRVEYPIDVSEANDGKPAKDSRFQRWRYATYNFTLATYWTPHLVKSDQADENGPSKTGIFNLYLDEPDEEWTTKIDEFSYVIISAGHWFFRSLVYRERREIVGCNYCLWNNVKDLGMYYGYRRAFRTAFKAINELKNFKGITFLRTFAPSHFENGLWNQGGNCLRTVPFRSNETQLEAENLELYMTQVEEYRVAEREGRRRGRKFRLLDTTMASLLRPDGHPSKYGHWPEANVTLYNDCVHWCLPGPIDNWNDFLLHMLKMEGIRSAEERAQFGGRNFKIR